MIEVTIERVVSDGLSDAFVVFLREKDGKRLLPIWIRRLEAESIAAAVQQAKPKRPLTHDLCKSLIGALGGTLQAVHVTLLQNDTYYAELLIAQPDGVVHVDCRPSDAMAIAVRMLAPIFVEESLLTEINVQLIDVSNAVAELGIIPAPSTDLTGDQLKAYLEKLRPEDFGKFSPVKLLRMNQRSRYAPSTLVTLLRAAVTAVFLTTGVLATPLAAQETREVQGRVVRPVPTPPPQAGAPKNAPTATATAEDSTGVAPVPDLMVTLHRVGNDAQAPLDSMRTSATGEYHFKYKTSGAPSAVYFTSATWGGIAYFTAPFRTRLVRGTDAEITVFDTTTKTFPLVVSGRHLIVSAPDTSNQRTVIEVFELSNDSIKTLTSGADSGGVATWSVSVPGIARDLKANEGEISPEAFSTSGGRVSIFSAIAPGVKQVSFSYRIPNEAFPMTFPIEYGAMVMEVLLEDPNGTVTGGGLVVAEPQSIENRTFRRFLAQDVKDGAEIEVNLPAGPSVGRNLYIAALLGTIGVIMLLILLRAMQRNRPAAYVGLPPVRAREAPLADRLAREIADLDATFAHYENPTDAMKQAYDERRAELKDALAAEIARG